MAFRSARKRAKRGLQETADYIGVTKQAVNLWERGVNEPNIETLKRLSEFYKCTIEELIASEDTDNAE